MSNTLQKFCFRYDGSDEADKALELINETFKTDWVGCRINYYTSSGLIGTVQPSDYTLVTPSEFIRLMKGEDEPKLKVGDECMIDEQHNLKTYKIEHITSDNVCMLNCLTIDKGYTIRHLSTLRPKEKSLREEILHLVAQHHNKHHQTITDEIIQLLKERGVEG